MSALNNLAAPNDLVGLLVAGNESSDGDEDSSSSASPVSASSSGNEPLSLVRQRRQKESRLDRLEGQIGRLTSLLEGKKLKTALAAIRIPSAKQDGAGSGSGRSSRRDRKKQRKKRNRRSNRDKLASFLSHSDAAAPRRGKQPTRSSRFRHFLPSRVPSSSDDDDFKLPGPTSADTSTSLYDRLAGITLARILHGHRSVYQFVQSNPWKNQRGMHEARRISLVLDSLLEELGSQAESLTATEMLVRNLVGLRFADDSNSTSMLEIMELAPPSALLPKQLEQAAFKAAKRLDTFRSNTRGNRQTGDRNKTNNNNNNNNTKTNKTKNQDPSGSKSGGKR